MFNMLFLYLIAPPIFATQPMDGGGKTKQWMTAFIVQAFSVFGTVIAMRLLLILLPIVTSSKLVLFENSMLNIMAKLVLMYGLFEVSKKATGLLTGILADSAGWQSVQAGDMSGSAGKLIGGTVGRAKALGGAALGAAGKVGGKVAGVATKPLQNVAKRGYDATIGKAAKAWNELGSDKAGQERREAEETAKKNKAVEAATERLYGEKGAFGDEAQRKANAEANGGSGGAVSSTPDSGSKPVGTAAGAMPGVAGGSPSSGGGASGGGAAKTPPPLPGKASAGSTRTNTAGGGGPAAGGQKSQEAPAAIGSRPSIGAAPKPSSGAKEAPTPRSRPTLD